MAMSALRQGAERLPFAEVVSRHQTGVYRFLLRFTRSAHDAADLFQEVFLRAHRAYPRLPVDADLRAWLMRIAVNLTKNHIRDRQRRQRVIVPGDASVPAPATRVAAGADMELISQEVARTLSAAIEALPFRQRAALVQRQLEGLDYPTIAANLGCSQDSARAHVYQALRKLRLALATDEG
jgi:RNA polymerase sigma-70 factor (ECF subfamily)